MDSLLWRLILGFSVLVIIFVLLAARRSSGPEVTSQDATAGMLAALRPVLLARIPQDRWPADGEPWSSWRRAMVLLEEKRHDDTTRVRPCSIRLRISVCSA